MKSLVVFYSRSGTTKRAAVALSRILGSDIEEILDTKDRSGIKGWWLAGGDAFLKKSAIIKNAKKDPRNYRVVIIGTPVWSFTVTPAVRAYILKKMKRFKKVAFFSTKGGHAGKGEFKAMAELCGRKPVAILGIAAKEMKSGEYYEMLKKFAAKVKKEAK